MSNPWNAAWEEAEASVPPSVLVYDTIELQHPTFDQPVRAVTGVTDDMAFTLEAGANPGGGSSVTFKAIPFWADKPQFGEGVVPQSKITIDNVARELVPVLQAATAYRADLIAIFRQWRSDDLTEPCYGPVEFVIKKVTMNGTTIQGLAMLDNLGNKKFPTRNYTSKQFPGLSPTG